MLILLLALGVRLAVVQGVRSNELGDFAEAQRLRRIDLPATRGAIYDRDGGVFALSIPARTIYANPKQIRDPDAVAGKLARVLDLDRSELTAKLRRKDRGFVYVARRVDLKVAAAVGELELTGVGIVDEARRRYPSGSLASTVVGFVGTDAEGLSGLEHAYEELLAGRPGSRLLEQDPQGRRIPQGEFREVLPHPGSDLVLTLDRDIQHAAERALAQAVEANDAKGGTVIVLDPSNGEILAMANAPNFDPNDPSTIDEGAMRNRAVTDVYEPGSVNKIVTATAALAEGTAEPTSIYNVPAVIRVGGYPFSDAYGHATKDMSFSKVIADSSNVGTIKIALQLTGPKLSEYLRRFGYGRATALGLPGESSGILPATDRWATSLPTMAIGQGVSVTSLQLARVYATVANDGVAVEPKLVRGWVGSDGTMHDAPDSRRTRVVGSEAASAMRRILRLTVTEGTGKLAAIPGYEAAGKTGTAQKASNGGYRGYMASFFGFVPADEPRLVIGVTLDDPSPYWGGVVAAPVFREVGAAAVRILRVPPHALDAPPGPALVAQGDPAPAQPAPGARNAPAARAAAPIRD
jgi:cell division protein FtsI (penicillin-binding protein 3)